MATIISRLYPNQRSAKAVVDKLMAEGFLKRDIDIISHKADAPVPVEGKDGKPAKAKAAKPDRKKIFEQIRQSEVYAKAAEIYAGHVADGKHLVVVRAPVGQAVRAKAFVNEFESIDVGVKHPDFYRGTREKSSYSRSRYHLPELLRNDQTMMTGDSVERMSRSGTRFSSWFGLPMLMEGGGKARLITKRTTPFSSLLGLGTIIKSRPHTRLITKNTTPFSSLFGLPLLTQKRDRRRRA